MLTKDEHTVLQTMCSPGNKKRKENDLWLLDDSHLVTHHCVVRGGIKKRERHTVLSILIYTTVIQPVRVFIRNVFLQCDMLQKSSCLKLYVCVCLSGVVQGAIDNHIKTLPLEMFVVKFICLYSPSVDDNDPFIYIQALSKWFVFFFFETQ